MDRQTGRAADEDGRTHVEMRICDICQSLKGLRLDLLSTGAEKLKFLLRT